VTAFLIGPLGIWIGTGLGTALLWLNSPAPILSLKPPPIRLLPHGTTPPP